MVFVARATFNIWRVITSLGRLRGCEGEGPFLNHMDVGNINMPRGCLCCPGGCSIAQRQVQLSNWPQGLDRAQAGLSWRTTDACLDGQRSRVILSET